MATLTLNVTSGGTATVGARVDALWSGGDIGTVTDANGQVTATVNATFRKVAIIHVEYPYNPPAVGNRAGGAGYLLEAGGTITINM